MFFFLANLNFLIKKKFFHMIICTAKLDVTLNKLIQDTGHVLCDSVLIMAQICSVYCIKRTLKFSGIV